MTDLNELLKYGILSEEEIHKQLKMKKTESMLKEHPHPITQLSNGRWQTYYDDPATGKKIEVKLATRDKVIDRLYDLYYKKSYTFEQLFPEWLEYKRSITASPNTITRHQQHYNKYLAGRPVITKDIRRIKKTDLNSFCNSLVKDFSLSSKEWMNVKTVINGVFDYAVDKEILGVNPMSQVRITVKYRQVNRKPSATQCFNTNELADFKSYMYGKYAETKDSSFASSIVQMLTGLRIGELAVIKWADVDYEAHQLHVVREETKVFDTGEFEVVPHTKGNRDRFVVLVPEVESLLKEVYANEKRHGEYVFTRDGERLTARQLAYVYKKYARNTKSDFKSSHKARKTYASMLQKAGVPMEVIREMLGHKDLATTFAYLFSTDTPEQTYDSVVNAMS